MLEENETMEEILSTDYSQEMKEVENYIFRREIYFEELYEDAVKLLGNTYSVNDFENDLFLMGKEIKNTYKDYEVKLIKNYFKER